MTDPQDGPFSFGRFPIEGAVFVQFVGQVDDPGHFHVRVGRLFGRLSVPLDAAERPAGFRFPVVLTGRRKQPEGLQGHVVFVPDNDPVFPDSFRFRAGQRDGTVVLPAALR